MAPAIAPAASVDDRGQEDNRESQVTTIAGQVYTNEGDAELGLGSYHFDTELDAYISYESDKCAKLYPRIDQRFAGEGPGDRIPRRMPFRGASYDPKLRLFKGWVTFSRDVGAFEEVRTIDGIEREEYELVFSPDFENIVSGTCQSFCPNASRPHRVEHFGTDMFYTRWSRQETPNQRTSVVGVGDCGLAAQEEPRNAGSDAGGKISSQVAIAALMARDEDAFRRALEAGISIETGIDSAQVWQLMRWDPGAELRTAAPPQMPLMVAAILLQWPAGVELCVRWGADVNGTYTGPFRGSQGSAAGGGGAEASAQGSPMLRVALSARSQSQCLICRHILDGGVDLKVFQRIKKKLQEEMEVDTKDLFNHWLGPFRRSTP